jgi:hypothetical protein
MQEADPMKLKTIATYFTAAAVVGILAGCATSGGASGDGEPAGGDLPADTAVVRVEQTGGFVTAQTNFSRVPDLAVYADGRAITAGAQIMIYPPPALPSLQVAQLSESQVERIVDVADDAGLLVDGIEYGEPGISDATTTVVTIVDGDTTYVHEAYALAGAGSDSEGSLPGLDDAAIDARKVLTSFITEATTIAGEAADAEIWEPEAYSIQATPAQPTPTEGVDDLEGSDGAVVEPALPWDLTEVDLSLAAECIGVDGDVAVQLREQLAAANILTRFTQAEVEYDVWTRPAFPGEKACAISE